MFDLPETSRLRVLLKHFAAIVDNGRLCVSLTRCAVFRMFPLLGAGAAARGRRNSPPSTARPAAAEMNERAALQLRRKTSIDGNMMNYSISQGPSSRSREIAHAEPRTAVNPSSWRGHADPGVEKASWLG